MDADAAITAPEPELPPTVLTDPGNIQELPVPSAQPPSPAPSSPHMDPGISTPRPSTGDSPPSAPQSSPPEAGRQLNVTDALSYLDAVKVQFQERPEVYNQFLDIMKDFKSQSIDTPGVISRVSRLFHGNPILIQGFNTFLPVGYRIDISDPADPSIITVTTPQGITTQNTFIANNLSRSHVGTPTFPGAIPAIPVHVTGPASRSHSPHPFNLHGQLPSFDPPYSPSFQNTQTTAAASVLGNMGNNNKGPVEAQPPGEFNHAIHYLNKIKARYSDDANTYKQFLDILQTYQKEQRHLQDPAFQSQVYVQVQLLFKDAPDLLAEFKDFLPEAVAGQNQGPAILPQPVASGSVSTWVAPENNQSSSPGEKTIKKAAVPSKRKKRGAEKEPTPVPPTKPAPNRTKKVKHNHTQDSTSTSFSPLVQPSSPQSTSLHVQPPQGLHTLQGSSSTHVMGTLPGAPSDKLLFFDRAKKSLESREIYEDFLKLLSLFSKEIIDSKTLIERANVFLGDELLAEFKGLIGWDERQDDVEKGPPGSIRTGPPEALSALPADDGEGPSYRRLPDSEIRLACSGRDELCRSVLNDEWVSHPTWASEEAGFISHKKNSFEEALHKSEEERFEYHVHLEALARTIAVLEPLNNRIEEMTNDERTLFKLKANYGGPSKAIYHRIIKKVYGRDSGVEVIQALQDCPSVAVPVVLMRLKQKDEDWRRAQREWSRTWREVDSKNFYKSLDHQGISFKANDKKSITSKHFVTDIESIKNQQLEASQAKGVASFARGSVGYQLEYTFHDTSVLLDSLKMIYSFLDRSQANYSVAERRAIEKFLRAFIPVLCRYPVTEFNAACRPLEGGHEDDPSDLNGVDGTRSGRRSAGSSHSNQVGGVAAGDLRRKLLRTVQEKAAGKLTPSASRDPSPSPEHRTPNHSRNGDVGDSPRDIWITEVGAGSFTQSLRLGSDLEQPLFVNTTFYTLLRLLQLLYSRLFMCKEIGAKHAAEKHSSLLANRVAVELGLDEPNGPSAVLEQAMEVLDDRGANGKANVIYMYLLNACEKMFDGDMDQATFEEHMRWFFGNKAYHLFTLDKLITALVKQVQSVLSDNRCQELWKLCRRMQNVELHTTQDIVRYRREAERHVGQDDHLYRLEWVRDLKCVRIYLMSAEDPSTETDGSAVSRWRGYVDSYVMKHPTEWVVRKDRGMPVFLRRCIGGEEECTAFVRHMRIRVGLPSYKLMYESGSEDVAWRAVEQKLLGRAQGREDERRKSVYLIIESLPLVLPEVATGSIAKASCALIPPIVDCAAISLRCSTSKPLSHPSPTPARLRHFGFASPCFGFGAGSACLAPSRSLIMAKPIFADNIACSASSTRPPCSSASRRKRKSLFPTPSAPVLAFLATISASLPSAQATPTPPSFLCPSFIPDPTPTLSPQARGPRPPSKPPAVKKSLIPRGPPVPVPDRFEQDESGRWRRVETYTLYGSTVCLSCDGDAVTTIFDDQIQDSATSSVPLSTSAASSSTYSISLPPGWKPQQDSSAGRTTLILALSLVLACLICFFIISCIFWRKKKRRRRGQADVEKKARKRWRQPAGDDDGISAPMEREVKVKQKIWAKATARWKANAKYAARQRRGKRFGMTTRVNSPRSSCASLDRAEETQTTVAQPPISTSLDAGSRRSSLESVYAASEAPQSGDAGHLVSIPAEETRADDPLQASSRPPSPPAYHGDSLARTSGRHKGLPISESGPTLMGSIPQSSSCDFHSQNIPPYPVLAAHVATDDKTLLARMAELASAPPPDPTSSSDSSDTCHASVPIWNDEEPEDFGEGSHENESAHRELSPSGLFSSPSSPSTLFPSPPSKGKMAVLAFYDYPYTFDDMLVEPEPGPSAPPFEEESHHHPSELTGLAPSAPPLTESEAAYYADTYPSAPAHDWQYGSDSELSAVDGHTAITIPPRDDVPSGSRSPVVQGPVSRDGTLPSYHLSS